MEEKRPGEYMPVFEDEHGTFIFSSKDLCTIKMIDQILDLGVDSLKIEGRMKGIYYVANSVKAYREAIDKYYEGNFEFEEKWLRELESTSHRLYTEGFYHGRPGAEAQNYNDRNSYSQTHQLVAKVIEKISDDEYILAIRNRVEAGEELEVVTPKYDPRKIVLPKMMLIGRNGHEEEVLVANPNSTVRVVIPGAKMEALDMIRKVKDENPGAEQK